MEKKSVTKNYIYNLIYQILIIIMPIITTPYLARTLGAEGTGIYSYTISIVTYFILFGTLGVSTYAQREIAYVQNDAKKRSKIFYEVIILRFITMVISMLIFYLTFGREGEYALYYRILLIEMLANCVDISFFYQGIENFKKTVTVNIIVRIISVISIFLFVKEASDLSTYMWIYVLTTLFGNMTMWIGIRKYITKVKFKELNIIRNVKPIIIFFIPQIAVQIYAVLDKTMIGTITGDMSEVGYYEQTQKIIKTLLAVITSLGTVMMPRIAKCFADGDKEQIKKYMHQTFRFVFMLALPLIFGVIAVADNFVPLFFGEGYDKVKTLMPAMSAIILFIGLSNVIGTQYLLSIKKQKQYTTSVVCGAIVNVICNLILIRFLDSLGAVIATVIAEFTVTFVQFYCIRNEFKISEILSSCKPYIIPTLIMFAITLIIDRVITSNMIGIITQVVVGVIVYFAYLILRKDELVMNILGRVIPKIKNQE